MISYLFKWVVASLVMPLLVLIFGRIISNMFVLFFWPGSIVLMSLGAEKKPIYDVLYVWGVAVTLNIVLYVFIGLVTYYLMRFMKS